MARSRSYGWSDTIHRDKALDVETDDEGNVVAVWFRCQPLPFTQTKRDEQRAEEMRRMYADSPMPKLLAVDLED